MGPVFRLFLTVGLVLVLAGWPSTAQDEKLDKDLTITFGAVMPHSSFMARHYQNKIIQTLIEFRRSTSPSYNFTKHFKSIQFELVRMPIVPSPREILDSFCNSFLPSDVPTIIFMSNSEQFTRDTAAAQYFLQLANYLDMPVIAWNAANSGFEKRMKNSAVLQLAPSIQNQAMAMLDILQKFSYKVFSIVTSHIAGHSDFLQAIRAQIAVVQPGYPLAMLGHETVDVNDDEDLERRLSELKRTDTRIFLMYATNAEAEVIFAKAHHLGLTRREYLWLVTQSVVGIVPNVYRSKAFPVGLMGIHFDTSHNGMTSTLINAVKIFANGLESYLNDPLNADATGQWPNMSCFDDRNTNWSQGQKFYRHLKNMSITNKQPTDGAGSSIIEFNEDGTLKYVTLEVVNLNDQHDWQTVGTWSDGNVDIHGIVWPGGDHTPPLGMPEKFHLRVTFLEEPPYLNMMPMDEATGTCRDKALVCRIPPAKHGFDITGVALNHTHHQCCSGFTVDLLKMLSVDIGFTFEMQRVEDGLWGTEVKGMWNGLIAELVDRKTDIVMTSLKVNSQRQKAVDFSVPFMETGIAVIVAKRTGIISPKAILEPFDTTSWVLILVVSIQATALSIFIFEWLSPDGYNRKIQRPQAGHSFSLFRTYWLVWAILFGASVNVNCPRGLTARFIANVWAAFAVVFLAIYTANLAAFMITREDYYKLAGIEDRRLVFPFSQKPPLQFGTIPFGNTDTILKTNFPEMHQYMRNYNRSTVGEGVTAVKRGELDAFIYDATVLDFLVGQDDECRLLTVGQWYAMTGYAVAFPRNSKYLGVFNDQLLSYRSHGVLERLTKFWLTGACQQGKLERSKLSFTYVSVALAQFMSAFILLFVGILLALAILAFEKFYCHYLRSRLAASGYNNIFALISLNLSRSITFHDAVCEAKNLKSHKCKDPICDTLLWKARRELDLYKLKAETMENELRLIKQELNT